MAPQLSRGQATVMLRKIGFDNATDHFTTAVQGFQLGWNLGSALRHDGLLDQATSDALRMSYARARVGKPTMSAHFSYIEFRCKHEGHFPRCKRIWVLRTHVRRLEAYRRAVGDKQIRIVSGCRCKEYNATIPKASTASQHMFGTASDIDGLLSLKDKEQLKLFAGLGFKQSTGKVIHVDSRDRGGHNLTSSSQKDPATWKYAT